MIIRRPLGHGPSTADEPPPGEDDGVSASARATAAERAITAGPAVEAPSLRAGRGRRRLAVPPDTPPQT